MCIAIVKTKGAKISDEALKNCWDNNPDGAGFAYPKDGNVVIEKGFFNYNTFLNRLREVEKESDNTMLIHFRISTSGLVDKTNCHPHRINKKLVMIHNGVLHIDVPKDSKVSDTVLYCENYLKKLPKNFEYSDVMLEYIAEHIGSTNKFCFVNAEGDYAICNESAGTWVDGVWYSNTTYKYPRVKYTAAKTWYGHGYGGYYGRYDDDDKKEYGYGKVKKCTKYAYLSEEERREILEDPIFYDDVYNAVWDLPDDEFLLLGDNPYINMLSGELLSASEVEASYNKSRFIALKNFDSGYEESIYDDYIKWYNRVLEESKEELSTAEDTDDNEFVMYCPTCGVTREDDLDEYHGYCTNCGSALVCMSAADVAKL